MSSSPSVRRLKKKTSIFSSSTTRLLILDKWPVWLGCGMTWSKNDAELGRFVIDQTLYDQIISKIGDFVNSIY